MKKHPGSAGFTLIEVLVTLILLAILTAAVFPVVTQQIGQGEPTRAASDLSSIRTAIEMFNLNVKRRFPADLEDLVYRPVRSASASTSDSDVFLATTAGVYEAKDAERWNGPYFDGPVQQADAGTSTGTALATGFGGLIQNDLVCFDPSKAVASAAGACSNGTFVAVQVEGLTAAEFEAVNDLIDGQLETDGSAAGQSQTAGKLRFDASATPSVAYYLAVPFRQ